MKHLSGLQPEMLKKANELIQLCDDKDLQILVYCGVRTVSQQNKLYRQSRSTDFILSKREQLKTQLGQRFGEALWNVGPQKTGPKVTNAAGGQSWHNYGYAIDSAPLIGGKLIWDTEAPEWQVYGECVKEVGLFWAGDWKSFKEFPHAQFHEGKVRDVFSEEERLKRAKW